MFDIKDVARRMKIFAPYINLTLYRKSAWLDEFREKYDEPRYKRRESGRYFFLMAGMV
jgi:hypothetical protein